VPPLCGSNAEAFSIYGAPRALPGVEGCLRDPLQEPATDQVCPGEAIGLAGAQAVAVSPDSANVYVAGEDTVVALARDRSNGALHPASSSSERACVTSDGSSPCAVKDAALSGADALAISPDGRFVYVGASNSGSVSAFVRGRGGTLAPLPARTGRYAGCVAGVALAYAPQPGCEAHTFALSAVAALAISPDGRFLYAVSYGLHPGTDSIVALQRNPRDGGLRPLSEKGDCFQSLPGGGCRSLAGLEGASAITITPDGRFVYVTSQLSGSVRGFLRNRVTGALTPLLGLGGCVSSGQQADQDVQCVEKVPQLAGARSLALSPDGRELYVAAFDPGAVVVLARNRGDGRMSVLPPDCLQAEPDARCPVGLPFLRGATALAFRPHSSVLYATTEGGNCLVELLPGGSDGALTLASDSPAVSDPLSGPVAFALSPGGGNIYVASSFDDGVAALITGP